MPKTHHFVEKTRVKRAEATFRSLFCLFLACRCVPSLPATDSGGVGTTKFVVPGENVGSTLSTDFPSVDTLLFFLFRIVMSLCTAKEEGRTGKGVFWYPNPTLSRKKPGLCVQIRWQEKQAKRGRKERERETWKR